MKKSMYEISSEALEIASLLESGEFTPEIESALVINQHELQQKSINYAFVIKDSEYNVEAIDSEIKRLRALKTTEINKQERLKEAVKSAMNIYRIEKIESPIVKLSFRKSETVEIVSVGQISPKFMMTKTETSPDKTAIKEAIKAGEKVEGAILKTNYNLQIK